MEANERSDSATGRHHRPQSAARRPGRLRHNDVYAALSPMVLGYLRRFVPTTTPKTSYSVSSTKSGATTIATTLPEV